MKYFTTMISVTYKSNFQDLSSQAVHTELSSQACSHELSLKGSWRNWDSRGLQVPLATWWQLFGLQDHWEFQNHHVIMPPLLLECAESSKKQGKMQILFLMQFLGHCLVLEAFVGVLILFACTYIHEWITNSCNLKLYSFRGSYPFKCTPSPITSLWWGTHHIPWSSRCDFLSHCCISELI